MFPINEFDQFLIFSYVIVFSIMLPINEFDQFLIFAEPGASWRGLAFRLNA